MPPPERTDRPRARYPALHTVIKARISPASFTGLPLMMACLAGLLVAAVLARLLYDMRELEGVVCLQASVNAAFAAYRTASAIAAFLRITALGTGLAISGMATVALLLLWPHGPARLLMSVWLAALSAEGTTWAAKYAVGRARPAFLDAVTAATPYFPSGHATAFTALINFLAYAAAHSFPGPAPGLQWCPG